MLCLAPAFLLLLTLSSFRFRCAFCSLRRAVFIVDALFIVDACVRIWHWQGMNWIVACILLSQVM